MNGTVCTKMQSPFEIEYEESFMDGEAAKLKTNISNLYYDRTVSISCEELYRLVEDLCKMRRTKDIHDDLIVLIAEFLNLQLMNLVCHIDNHFLHKLKALWLMYCHKSRLVKNMYMQLETYSYRQDNVKLSVTQMCMEMFKNIILKDETVRNKLDQLFVNIELERNGTPIDQKLIKDVVSMLDHLGLYASHFEDEFLLKSLHFYKNKRDVLLKDDIIKYFYYVQEKIGEEKSRVASYMNAETSGHLIRRVYHVLIECELDSIIDKLEATKIFETNDFQDLVVVYDLLLSIPKANEQLCRIFNKHMMQVGVDLVFNPASEETLIEYLLNMKDRVDEVVTNCFKSDKMYTESIKDCFKAFLNQRKYVPAQLLAKFIDIKMRDKLIPEDLLDKIMVLFRFIEGKDVFEAYYKRYLSKRLLLGKSSSQDAEKYMIGKLKSECGEGFTSRLEGMFKDIDLSENLTTSFKQRPSNCNLPIEFTAHVLTSSFWPMFTKDRINLSDKMMDYLTTFQDFYKAKYSGRSLLWVPGLGSCLIKASLQNGSKEFQVSLYQAVIMLLFNDTDQLTYKSIRLYLDLTDDELVRTLLSLIRRKVRLLIKNPALGEIKDDDVFSLNHDYNNKLFRIRINQLQYKETEKEKKITEEEVCNDRHLQIDAALVRLMKQNRNMRHNDLISQIFQILKFPMNPNDIKKRIEILIERDFIARNPDDKNSYFYVA